MAKQGAPGISPAELFQEAASAGPLTRDELAEYNTRRAAEMAKAEARRQPSPQLDLQQAA